MEVERVSLDVEFEFRYTCQNDYVRYTFDLPHDMILFSEQPSSAATPYNGIKYLPGLPCPIIFGLKQDGTMLSLQQLDWY
jgi:hypothetical protein